MSAARLVRYVVSFRDSPPVGYHTGLGTKAAWGYALETARTYGGRLEEEDSDGRFEIVRDWSRSRPASARPAAQSSLTQSPEGAAELGSVPV